MKRLLVVLAWLLRVRYIERFDFANARAWKSRDEWELPFTSVDAPGEWERWDF
ncbi:MAG TPA: hypothetical protein VH593_06790 [Ktedonobacteraceae bacterium]